MRCNLRWLLILVGNFCRRYILLRQHQFFSLGDFTDSFGRVASVTVQEWPVAGLSVAPQAVARQPVTMQSEAACAVEGRSPICITGMTSAYGHVVNGIYRPYDNANGAQAVADILQPVSNMSSMWQLFCHQCLMSTVLGNQCQICQLFCILFRMLGKLFKIFPNPEQVFGNRCRVIQMLLVIFRNWVLLEILPNVLRNHLMMPTFDPKTTNWTTFIQDFEDLVVEMGWHGQKISKLKLCFSGTVKEFFRALPLECHNNDQLLKKRFGAIFGTADEQQSSALKLYNIQQESDQDLHTFVAQIMILASKAFPYNAAMADLMTWQAFLKGCKHQTEARMVISMNRCSSLDEAVDEVRCLLENY